MHKAVIEILKTLDEQQIKRVYYFLLGLISER